MNDEEMKAAVKETAEHYGTERQMDILQEECAELIQAISKVRRYGESKIPNLIEEIADVETMIQEVKYLFNISDEQIRALQVYKTHRELKRIEAEEKENEK